MTRPAPVFDGSTDHINLYDLKPAPAHLTPETLAELTVLLHKPRLSRAERVRTADLLYGRRPIWERALIWLGLR